MKISFKQGHFNPATRVFDLSFCKLPFTSAKPKRAHYKEQRQQTEEMIALWISQI